MDLVAILPTDLIGRQQLLDAIHARCVDDAGCLRWTGALNTSGHPVMRLRGKVVLVRRVVYQLQCRPLVPEQRVIMRCECRGCIDTGHMLAASSHQRMMREAARQGRLASPLRSLKTARALRARSRWSDADIAAFRAAEGSVLERAERFGMSPTYAYLVHRGEARMPLGSALSPMRLGGG